MNERLWSGAPSPDGLYGEADKSKVWGPMKDEKVSQFVGLRRNPCKSKEGFRRHDSAQRNFQAGSCYN
jgi:hypothetical protein